MNERSVFIGALEKDNPSERAAYLDQVCAGDVAVRRRIERLLQLHERSSEFLAEPAPPDGATADERPPAEGPGSRVGPYKLLQQIGEGGMGVVFMAEQEEPIKRRVALKIIKPGMDSRQVIARFEAERQALAMMDHQNIARVLDAGMIESEPRTLVSGAAGSLTDVRGSGRPYFVMELVHGIPITKFCDEHQLTPRQRLELFVPVCQAIQHAHQKGIIHRDIKPSNVLVTLYDDKPVPKVIDFGVAKAVEQRLTERTLFTQFGAFVGTFEYMSPEQAEMNALGVDTRSDIYSLGVLLYELLTGTTPLEKQRLHAAALDELVRLIKEEEPPRPSVRLSSSDNLPRIAAARKTEPARLSKLVRGEIDWIVMRCLEKDRTRRYETASGLARDIQHYLADEPVEACPPSAGYRLHKLARKYKKPLTVAAAFGVLLLAALALVTWKWQDERAARADAEAARLDALNKARELEEAAERMNAANAAMDLGDLHVNFHRWPEAEAEFTKATELRKDHSSVWMRRARFYAHLGLWDLAAADWRKAFQLREPDASLDWYLHALLLVEGGDTDTYHRLCLRMLDRFGGSTDAIALDALLRTCCLTPVLPADLSNLTRRLEEARPTKATREGGVPDYFLGIAYYRAGGFEEATRHLRRSLADTTWAWRALNYPVLAMALQKQGQHDEARQELANARKTLEQWTQEVFDARDRFVPVPSWWDWVECPRFYREAHTLIEGSPPPEDPRLCIVRGRAFAALGRRNQAEAEFARALTLAPNDPQIRKAVEATKASP